MYTRKSEYCIWKFCWGPYDSGEPSEGPQYSLNSIDLKTCRGTEKIFMVHCLLCSLWICVFMFAGSAR